MPPYLLVFGLLDFWTNPGPTSNIYIFEDPNERSLLLNLRRRFQSCPLCLENGWSKGVAGRGSRTKGRGGEVRPKAEKKKVSPINLMVEVVSDVPLATSDDFSRLREVS